MSEQSGNRADFVQSQRRPIRQLLVGLFPDLEWPNPKIRRVPLGALICVIYLFTTATGQQSDRQPSSNQDLPASPVHSRPIASKTDHGTWSGSANPVVDFRTDIMPLFTRYGCNAAECHGSATGRGEFRLSLFGGDPQKDYWMITRHLRGRRVNYGFPERSLLITKPTEHLSHGGGEVFEQDSEPAKILSRWIRQGAKPDSVRHIEGIVINRKTIIADSPDSVFRLKVATIESTGSRDVSRFCNFQSSNPNSLSVTDSGIIRVKKPGKYYVFSRFLNFTATTTVILPFAKTRKSDPDSVVGIESSSHPIDEITIRSYRKLNLPTPRQADRNRVIRRLYLNLLGRLPDPAEASRLARSLDDPQQFRTEIRRLLNRDEFAVVWTRWLRNTIGFSYQSTADDESRGLDGWLKDQVSADRPYPEIVKRLLLSTGDSLNNPPAYFHRMFIDARLEAESVSRSFLGIRIGCANCHNHPLDRWTQEDYHGLAAIFATMKRQRTVVPFPEGRVIQPKTGKPAIPRIPGVRDLGFDQAHRKKFSQWLLNNPQFVAVTVNRVWRHFLGRGLVEPDDDFRQTNPPVDGDLLAELGRRFREDQFRFRGLIEYIVTSQLYRSQPIPRQYRDYVASYNPRPLDPALYYDLTQQVLFGDFDRETLEKVPAAEQDPPPLQDENRQADNPLPSDHRKRAIEALDLRSFDPGLAALSGCTPRSCEATNLRPQAGMREMLQLINGHFLNKRLLDDSNLLNTSVSRGRSVEEVLADLYLRTFTRPMNAAERRFWKQEIERASLKDRDQKRRFLQDAAWSLLNSSEFSSLQ